MWGFDMPVTKDRFVLETCNHSGRVVKGWRLERYSFGRAIIQHLRSGRSYTGVIDDFGNVIYPANDIHPWQMDTEEIVPYYKD